jgi:hypothetical protein
MQISAMNTIPKERNQPNIIRMRTASTFLVAACDHQLLKKSCMKCIMFISCLLLAFQFSHAQWQGTGSIYYNNGNVGIGTSAPAEKLDVQGTIKTANLLTGNISHNLNDNFNYDGRSFGHYALGWGLDSWNASPTAWLSGYAGIKMFTHGTPRVAINILGNVGIGTTAPAEKLDVQGTVKAVNLTTGNLSYNLNDNFNYDGRSFGHYALSWGADSWDVGGPSAWLSAYGGIKMFTRGTPRMCIDASGKVGIGTTTPKASLAVNGDILAKKVTVSLQNLPDYVFHASYRLRPLHEVEQYIQQYHHLPEVPSAEEVKKNGLDVGDNQATLLKKIEELTLYVIQLKKENNQLKIEMEEKFKKLEQANNVLKDKIKQ